MSLIITSAKIELSKIFTRKKYYILFLIEIAVTLLVVFLTSANGIKLFGFQFDLPKIPYMILGVLTSFILPLLIFMLSADLFTNELETSMIKSILLRPISRLKIFVSKMCAITVYIFMHLMLVCLIILFTKIFLGSRIDSVFNLLLAYALSIIPMLCFIAMSAFFCLLINNSSLAMFATMIIYFAMQGLTLLSAPIGAMLFSSHLEFYKMVIEMFNHFNLALINTVLMFAAYIALFSVGAYALFDRKEL